MTKHWLPLTYEPKIEAVFDGSCTQSIRHRFNLGRRYSVGDYVGFHTWEGLPYRSKWGRRTKLMEIVEVINLECYEETVIEYYGMDESDGWEEHFWGDWWTDDIARRDFINPPTGIALRDVLKSFYGEFNGQRMQIIRWNPEKVIE